MRENVRLYASGFLLVLMIQAPALILWEQGRIGIEDNLEPLVGFHAFAGANPEYWGSTMPVMLGGLPPQAYSPEPVAIAFIHRLLPPLAAYYLNETLIRLVAFAGMFALTGAVCPGRRWLHLLAAVGYAWLPFWTPGGVSVAALPLLGWAAYRLQRPDSTLKDLAPVYLILGAYPAYSLLANTGVFLVPFGGLFFFWSLFMRRERALQIGCGLLVLTLSFAASSLPLIANNVASEPIEWHRVEFRNVKLAGGVGREALYLLLKTHYHADAVPYPVLWILLLGGVGLAISDRLRRRPKIEGDDEAVKSAGRRLLMLTACIAAVAAVYYAYFDPGVFRLRERLPFLAQLNLSRLFFFLPPIWYLAAAFAAVRIWHGVSPARYAAPVLLVLQLGVLAYHQGSELLRPSRITTVPSKPTAARPLPGHDRYYDPGARPTFAAYKAEKLFDAAEALTGRDRETYWIACLGFYPSQAHLNNFRTVDGYWYLYPLERKRLWQRVIHKELSKSLELQWRYVRWGSRAYLFSEELGHTYLITKTHPIQEIRNLKINTRALSRLGARYIFSSIRIGNASELRLKLLGRVTDPEACMDLHVYEIKARTLLDPSVISPNPPTPYAATARGPGAEGRSGGLAVTPPLALNR